MTLDPDAPRWAESVGATGPIGERTILVDVLLPGEIWPREMELSNAEAVALRDMLTGVIEDRYDGDDEPAPKRLRIIRD